MDKWNTDWRRQGLSGGEAARRLAEDGPNQLPDLDRGGWSGILSRAVREPMFLLLVAAAVLYLVLGELHESVFLLLMVVVTLGLTLYEAGRTEHALQALRDLSAPMATVVRDARPVRIAAAGLVRGDLLILSAGDRVPADALLIEAGGMTVDESLLTGESVPVLKRSGASDSVPAPPGGEGLPWVYGGTLVVQGNGLAEVRALGKDSELGRIGRALGQLAPPEGRLQREIKVLVRRLAVLGLTVSTLLVLVLGLRDRDWLQALLAGIALSMSTLPEEFPVILTIFPALGAWRLAHRQVLTRRLPAIEVLGSTSILCVDKTGTLTENRMALRLLWRDGAGHDLDCAAMPAPAYRELLSHAVLASRPPASDPIEQAIHLAAARVATAEAQPRSRLEHEYGLTDERPAVIHIRSTDGEARAFAKGAPETIVALCRGAAADILPAAAALAADGLRVLAVASASQVTAPWPDDPAVLRYRLTGLLAFADPLRPDIPEAVRQCRAAGIRILMITGDHPDTAQAIARQAGMDPGNTLTGREIALLAPGTLASRLEGVSVCARIVPGQKLAIVRALQESGAVVAMTGDGVNDAPALRAADVGVAMGRRGTDVAREAADLTLLDDRFASLVHALRSGRRIYSNMRKSMRYVSAIHVPIAVMALLPALAGWPILLQPMHIVFMELVIGPACSLAFENEPEEPDLMRRPPRRHDEPLLGRAALFSALSSGLWASVLLGSEYALALFTLSEDQARSVAFSSLVLTNLALLLLYRQSGGIEAGLLAANPLLLAILVATVGMLGAALYIPLLAEVFGLAPAPLSWMGFAIMVPLAMMLGVQLMRRAYG